MQPFWTLFCHAWIYQRSNRPFPNRKRRRAPSGGGSPKRKSNGRQRDQRFWLLSSAPVMLPEMGRLSTFVHQGPMAVRRGPMRSHVVGQFVNDVPSSHPSETEARLSTPLGSPRTTIRRLAPILTRGRYVVGGPLAYAATPFPDSVLS